LVLLLDGLVEPEVPGAVEPIPLPLLLRIWPKRSKSERLTLPALVASS
jgi:hypothetical protein